MKIYEADANGNATGDPVVSSGNGATNGTPATSRAPSSIRPARTSCA